MGDHRMNTIPYGEFDQKDPRWRDCLWDKADVETVRYHTFDEAIEHLVGELPEAETLEITAFERDVFEVTTQDVLESTFEHLDEEHGNPDVNASSTLAIRQAAENLAAALQRDFAAWGMHPVAKVEVDLATWRKREDDH